MSGVIDTIRDTFIFLAVTAERSGDPLPDEETYTRGGPTQWQGQQGGGGGFGVPSGVFFEGVFRVDILLPTFVTLEKRFYTEELAQRRITIGERSLLFFDRVMELGLGFHPYDPLEDCIEDVTFYHGLCASSWGRSASSALIQVLLGGVSFSLGQRFM